MKLSFHNANAILKALPLTSCGASVSLISLPVKWGYILPRKDVVRTKQCMKGLRVR